VKSPSCWINNRQQFIRRRRRRRQEQQVLDEYYFGRRVLTSSYYYVVDSRAVAKTFRVSFSSDSRGVRCQGVRRCEPLVSSLCDFLVTFLVVLHVTFDSSS
jgi:hypothetical protein